MSANHYQCNEREGKEDALLEVWERNAKRQLLPELRGADSEKETAL
jgi:hypothetical protein